MTCTCGAVINRSADDDWPGLSCAARCWCASCRSA